MYVELVDGCKVYVLHFKTCGMLVILQSYVEMLIHLNLIFVWAENYMDAIVCAKMLHVVWAEFFVLLKKNVWTKLCGLE